MFGITSGGELAERLIVGLDQDDVRRAPLGALRRRRAGSRTVRAGQRPARAATSSGGAEREPVIRAK